MLPANYIETKIKIYAFDIYIMFLYGIITRKEFSKVNWEDKTIAQFRTELMTTFEFFGN